jgi:hypothetical protein
MHGGNESIDKTIHGMVSKSSGCNQSERIGDLEKHQLREAELIVRGVKPKRMAASDLWYPPFPELKLRTRVGLGSRGDDS